MKNFFTSILTLLLSTSAVFGQVEDNKIYTTGKFPITIELLEDRHYCDYSITGTFFFRYSEQEIDLKDYFSRRYRNEWYYNLPPIPQTENGQEDILYLTFKIESSCPEDSIGYISGSRIMIDTPNYFYKTVVISNREPYYDPRLDSYRTIFDRTYTQCFLDRGWKEAHKSDRDFQFIKLAAEQFSYSFVKNYSRRIECSLSTSTTPNNEYTQVAYKAVNCKDLDVENPLVFVPRMKVVMRDLFDQINFHDHLTKYWISVHKTKTALGKKRPFIYLFKLEVK